MLYQIQQIIIRAWLGRGPVACLLWPVSVVFGALVGLRRWGYRRGWWNVSRVPVPVVVVGNVVAGGAGKTPLVIALVRHWQQQGKVVGVVSRGYGRRTHDCREVLADSVAHDVGDEPALVQRLTGAPVFVALQRAAAARALLRQHPNVDIIVCDDGLQHYALHRDMEICVFDNRGIGNGWMLPAGPLREPWPRAVSVVLHSGSRPAFAGFTAQRHLSDHAVRRDGSKVLWSTLANTPLTALAAIARPDEFFDMLRAQGLQIQRTTSLPDHYDFNSYTPSSNMPETLICTEKDAVKLWLTLPGALAAPLLFAPEPAFFSAVDGLLAASLSSAPSASPKETHGQQTS